jgi:hypothetical protein
MGVANVPSGRRRYRRARRLRQSRRGVVAVIGTLLALLVFFALFGIFLTQYVPLWMTDNESQFSSQAAASFLQFKSNIDQQYVLHAPQSYGTPFTVSSQGIPLIAQPTQGTLVFLPTTCPGGFYAKGTTGANSANYGQPTNPTYCVFQNLTLSAGPGASGPYYQNVPSGVVNMVLPNRYFNQEMFYFEDDGVVQSQGGASQIMAFPPPLNVTTIGGNTSFTTSFLQLYGNASTVIGQGSEQVFSHLRYSQLLTSNGKPGQPFVVTYEIGTQYPCAWQRFFMAQMNVSGVPYAVPPTPGVTSYNWTNPVTHSASIPVANSACTSSSGLTTVLAVNLYAVDYATIFYAGVQVVLGVGGT